MNIEKIIDGEKYSIKVVTENPDATLSENDKEMDFRAKKSS